MKLKLATQTYPISQMSSDLLIWSHNVFEFLKFPENRQYRREAFVQAALAQFIDHLKSQKASGFLRKLHDLCQDFVPQPVGQRTASISCLWSAKPEPRSTKKFVAFRRSTMLKGAA